MAKKLPKISGWGMHPVVRGCLDLPRDETAVGAVIATEAPVIARGNGRSYGDSSFNARGAVSMLKLDKFISVDAEEGLLVCEAGVLLGDVISAMLPRGWFPPVTPGTKFVTIGGMIASNVHGKNCVRDGAFGDHVAWLDLMLGDGSVVRCSGQENADLFADTIGGMGLTGMILRAAFRLKRAPTGWVKQTRVVCENLDAVMAAFDESEDATYRVAWIDVLAKGDELGRSLLDIGEHAELEDLDSKQKENPFGHKRRPTLTVPFAPPVSPLNGLTVKAFNAQHYWRGSRSAGESLVPWDSYFYPLDSLLKWNRIYGRKGFAQYQCVLPLDTAKVGLTELLEAISEAGRGSFLAVLKRLGDTIGTLSFPMEGYTLALDFPWSQKTADLLDKLDTITAKHGGRVYLTKDSRLGAATFTNMQPTSDDFRAARKESGATAQFKSLQSERLGL